MNVSVKCSFQKYCCCIFFLPSRSSGALKEFTIPDDGSSQVYNNLIGSSSYSNQVHNRQWNKELMIPSSQAYEHGDQNMIGSNHMQNGMGNIVNNISMNMDPAEVQIVLNSLLPPGYRFLPTDLQLVEFYLKRKVYGQPLPANIIPTFFVYSMSSSELTARFNPIGNSEWYFFSQRHKKYQSGNRPDRSTPEGFWRVTRSDQHIPPEPPILGVKRTLAFFLGSFKQSQKTDWKMHEYVLVNPSPTKPKDKKQLDECVLCRIYKSNTKVGSKRRGQRVTFDDNAKTGITEASSFTYQSYEFDEEEDDDTGASHD